MPDIDLVSPTAARQVIAAKHKKLVTSEAEVKPFSNALTFAFALFYLA